MAVISRVFFVVLALTGTYFRGRCNEVPPVVIHLKAIPGLQFDLARFSVNPGAKVTLTLTNTDDMSHNMLFTSPGARQAVVDTALKMGDAGPGASYIPAVPDVLWSIPVLSPGESKTITFTAPQTPGVYPYVCTYPGHGFVMYGAMYVTSNELPPLQSDVNIPPNRRTDDGGSEHAHSHKKAHPYEENPPYFYRTFTREAGPATIAVRLPQNLSYFWDAATCRLKVASHGGFLDMQALWAGHRQATARNLGNVFFQDETEYPLRVDNVTDVNVRFKGYRLVERYPEFHYSLNGMDVYELIREKPDGTGLIRTFRVPNPAGALWFVHSPGTVVYTSSAGKWSNAELFLTPLQAKEFTITMTFKE